MAPRLSKNGKPLGRPPRVPAATRREQKAAEVDGRVADGRQRRNDRKRKPEVVFTDERKALFLAVLGAGLTVTRACRVAGVRLANARTHYRIDDDFRRAWDLALDTGTDVIDDAIMGIATRSKDDRVRLDALKFLARARKPEVYSESTKVAVSDARTGPSKERLAELRAAGRDAAADDPLTAAIELVAAAFADDATKPAE